MYQIFELIKSKIGVPGYLRDYPNTSIADVTDNSCTIYLDAACYYTPYLIVIRNNKTIKFQVLTSRVNRFIEFTNDNIKLESLFDVIREVMCTSPNTIDVDEFYKFNTVDYDFVYDKKTKHLIMNEQALNLISGYNGEESDSLISKFICGLTDSFDANREPSLINFNNYINIICSNPTLIAQQFRIIYCEKAVEYEVDLITIIAKYEEVEPYLELIQSRVDDLLLKLKALRVSAAEVIQLFMTLQQDMNEHDLYD